jgi:hypothetical protein
LRESAEVASVVAIIITLAILIVEVRDNTAATRASSYEELLGDVNDFVMTIATDPELTHIYQKWQNEAVGDLTDDEKYRLVLILKTGFRNYEKAYFATQYGTLGVAEAGRFDRVACGYSSRLVAVGLYQEVIRILTPEYVAYVEHLCNIEG